ncbi:MAG: DUF6288 domain-containing protein [bacterium]
MMLASKHGVLVMLLSGYCLQGTTILAADQAASGYYTEPQLYGMRPNPNAETEMGPIGATGMDARIYKGVRVTVENVQPNTPASGKNGEPKQVAVTIPVLGTYSKTFPLKCEKSKKIIQWFRDAWKELA